MNKRGEQTSEQRTQSFLFLSRQSYQHINLSPQFHQTAFCTFSFKLVFLRLGFRPHPVSQGQRGIDELVCLSRLLTSGNLHKTRPNTSWPEGRDRSCGISWKRVISFKDRHFSSFLQPPRRIGMTATFDQVKAAMIVNGMVLLYSFRTPSIKWEFTRVAKAKNTNLIWCVFSDLVPCSWVVCSQKYTCQKLSRIQFNLVKHFVYNILTYYSCDFIWAPVRTWKKLDSVTILIQIQTSLWINRKWMLLYTECLVALL